VSRLPVGVWLLCRCEVDRPFEAGAGWGFLIGIFGCWERSGMDVWWTFQAELVVDPAVEGLFEAGVSKGRDADVAMTIHAVIDLVIVLRIRKRNRVRFEVLEGLGSGKDCETFEKCLTNRSETN
jgi:hypothetical protein